MTLLLALASAQCITDTHALSVNLSCSRFLMGNSNVFTKAKIPRLCPRFFNLPIELSAFYPLFSTHERLNVLCLVRALRTYADKTAGFRGKSEQLFASRSDTTFEKTSYRKYRKQHLTYSTGSWRLLRWPITATSI